MANRRTIKLTEAQQVELEQIRDHHGKAYLREKAAALLKVASGMTAHAVAKQGLLKPRDPDSVYSWLERYEAEGVAGLIVQSGRGRKPSFSP